MVCPSRRFDGTSGIRAGKPICTTQGNDSWLVASDRELPPRAMNFANSVRRISPAARATGFAENVGAPLLLSNRYRPPFFGQLAGQLAARLRL
jgi:hypothetical protein